MEENRSSPDEINSIAYMDKKRKVQNELLEMPLPKHVCRDHQHLECGSLMDSNSEAKNLESDEFPRGSESDPESMNSNSFHFNSDSIMSTDDEMNTDLEYPETCLSDERCTSSATSAATSSEVETPYSSESRSFTNSSSSLLQSSSISEQPNCPHEERLVEFGNNANFSFSEYGNAEEELENLLYSNGAAPSNYILSSGRWTVNQDTEQESKKLTIDKEFEQYFSMLML